MSSGMSGNWVYDANVVKLCNHVWHWVGEKIEEKGGKRIEYLEEGLKSKKDFFLNMRETYAWLNMDEKNPVKRDI